MVKFNLARDTLVIISGVIVSFSAGNHETKDEEVIRVLRGVKGCAEVTKTTKSKTAE